MGDALLQKTYTIDFLKKKRIKNTGQMPQYYVSDCHKPIIPKELFMQVQEEIAKRSSISDCNGRKRGFSANSCFTYLVYCGSCGEVYRRIHWNNRVKRSVVWRCENRLMRKTDCSGRTIKEEDLKLAFTDALIKLQDGKTE